MAWLTFFVMHFLVFQNPCSVWGFVSAILAGKDSSYTIISHSAAAGLLGSFEGSLIACFSVDLPGVFTEKRAGSEVPHTELALKK